MPSPPALATAWAYAGPAPGRPARAAVRARSRPADLNAGTAGMGRPQVAGPSPRLCVPRKMRAVTRPTRTRAWQSPSRAPPSASLPRAASASSTRPNAVFTRPCARARRAAPVFWCPSPRRFAAPTPRPTPPRLQRQPPEAPGLVKPLSHRDAPPPVCHLRRAPRARLAAHRRCAAVPPHPRSSRPRPRHARQPRQQPSPRPARPRAARRRRASMSAARRRSRRRTVVPAHGAFARLARLRLPGPAPVPPFVAAAPLRAVSPPVASPQLPPPPPHARQCRRALLRAAARSSESIRLRVFSTSRRSRHMAPQPALACG